MNTSAAIVTLAATAMLTLGCGDKSPSGPAPARNDLVFTRADQSRITFASGAQLSVWCGPWESGVVATPSLQVLYGGPAAGDPYWLLRVVVGDVTIGQPLPFPNSFIWDQPKQADLYISDPANELSTQDGRSGGSVTFQQLSCGSDGEVQFTIDAAVGSEFGNGPSVSVIGDFRNEVGQPPS